MCAPVHARVEQLQPAQAFDTVITRAFAPLPRLLDWMAPLCDAPHPGRRDEGSLAAGAADGDGCRRGACRRAGSIESARPVEVPGLDDERNIILLRRTDARVTPLQHSLDCRAP